MVRGRLRSEWDQTAMLVTLVYNRTRTDDSQRPMNVSDVIPAHLLTAIDQGSVQVQSRQPLTGKEWQDLFGV